MSTVRLVCWNEDSSNARSRDLKGAGFRVDASPLQPGRIITHIRETAPAVIVIDLERLPSHGREVAVALRRSKWTRSTPIVFAGGLPEKVEKIRHELPDAVYTPWEKIAPALKKAVKNAPANPVRPVAHMDRYAGSSLVKKLGIKPDMTIALLGPPEDFTEKLDDLPESTRFQNRITAQSKLAIWFVRSRQELERETEFAAARLPEGASLWIVYPKQTGRYRVDFTQNDVRHVALQAALVDYKICAVDSDWTGLKFAKKR